MINTELDKSLSKYWIEQFDKAAERIVDLKNKCEELTKKNENLGLALIEKGTENADLSDRLAKLQRNFDRINHLWTGQIQENMELRSKVANMQREKKNYETIAKERADLLKEKEWVEKQLNYYKSIHYDLSDRAHRAEDEVEDLKKELDSLGRNRDAWKSRALEAEKRVGELLLKKYDQAFEDLRKERDRYSGLYTELRKDYDRLFEENRSLKEPKPKLVDYEALRKELDLTKRNSDCWKSRAMHAEKRYATLQKENTDLSGKIAELQKKGDDLTKKGEDLQQEIEELKKSRKHLRRLYVGEGTRKLWDMLQNVNDVEPEEFDPEFETLSDILCMDMEDFLDAYKNWQEEKEQNETDRMRRWLDDFCTGRLCSKCPLNEDEFKCGRGYSFAKRDRFDNRIVPDEDIKRYYEKARGCGVAPKEEEHQLDYGDAVRVPWRDYDYMYIGPEGKHIRLFNPKTHSVVIVPATENLPYQGCKIILCDEDDIRKIWKDKK